MKAVTSSYTTKNPLWGDLLRPHKDQLPNNSTEELTVTDGPRLSQQLHLKLHSNGFLNTIISSMWIFKVPIHFIPKGGTCF